MSEAAAQAYVPAAEAALAAFGVPAAAMRFVRLAENVTFRVTDARDGRPLVLRLHRPWYHTIEELRSEHLWTRALVAAGVATPEPLLTPAGESFAQVAVAATGERRWAGLARWVEGDLLGDVVAQETDRAANLRRFAGLGALMARMHDQAVAWTPPAGFTRHALDADGLMGPEPFWGPFWDHAVFTPEERALMLGLRGALHAALLRYGRSAATYSLIHADLHPRNVVVDGTRVAVIDFDDAGWGWHLYDLAVALNDYQDHPDFAAFRDAAVAGYRDLRPLPEADLGLLPMFLLIRDAKQIGWFHQRPEIERPALIPALAASVVARARRFVAPV